MNLLPLVPASLLLLAAGDAPVGPEAPFAAMTADEVAAHELALIRQVADLALIPPRLNTSPLPEYDYDQLDYGMTIGVTRTTGGRLWVAWVGGEDGPRAFMLLASSDDDGETWSKPRLVVDSRSPRHPIPRSVIVGTLWTDPLGRVWFFFDQTMNHFDGRGGLWYTICGNPDDDEPVWSEPRRLWHGSMLNKPTILSSGEWLLPVQLLQNPGFGPFAGAFPELDPLRGASIFRSVDQGATFERIGCVRLPQPDWHEHMLVERGDGSLWLLARTRQGIMESVSTDRGVTWSEPAPPAGIRQPPARFHIRRLASGRLLLVKHGDTADDPTRTRHKLKAFLSEDDGASWIGGLMLDERSGVSYPDGIEAPDGTIYLTWDRNRSTDGEVLLARITEADILAGCLVGERSRIGLLVCRPLKGRPGAGQ